MAKIKVENSFIWIILAAIRIYSANFLKFCGYMLFPVLGQVLGLLLVFCLAGWFSVYLPELAEKYRMFDNFSTIILCILLLTIPGLLIFMKAFWEYLVAYGAINSITECYLTTGKIYDFPAHKATVTRYSIRFIALWLLYSVYMSLAIIPFLWIPAAILFIYFILVFQVFSFEPEQSPIDYFTRSFVLIKGNAIRTLLIMLVIGLFTHVIFVQGVAVLFDFLKITQFLGALFEETLVTYIPIDDINNFMLMVNPSFNYLTPAKVSAFFIYTVVSFLVVGFTLPLRSVTWALWYKALREVEMKKSGKQPKRKAAKRLSPEIIDRANRNYND